MSNLRTLALRPVDATRLRDLLRDTDAPAPHRPVRDAAAPRRMFRITDTTAIGGASYRWRYTLVEVVFDFTTERFDRVGPTGRRALISLAAMDAEFIGAGTGGWPGIAQRLAKAGQIVTEAADAANLLWSFGTLIGNTDMHSGNLSFISEHGRPYAIAPAYDMTPMCFAPRIGGGLPDTIADAALHPGIANEVWRRAEPLSQAFLHRLRAASGFSRRFAPCIAALEDHIARVGRKIARLG